jgi:transcriptional antiterminator NusG
MNYFVIQVRARQEKKYLARARELESENEVRFFWPRRELRIRKAGEWRDIVSSIFPGYLFLETDEVTPLLQKFLKTVPNFIRFLKSNQNISPLSGRDLDLIRHFILSEEIVKKSLVFFTPEQRVRVISGPLKGLEGMIVKVDKRKKRIKVKLALYEDSFSIDFGYESLEDAQERGGQK